jgi:hypothetical protein
VKKIGPAFCFLLSLLFVLSRSEILLAHADDAVSKPVEVAAPPAAAEKPVEKPADAQVNAPAPVAAEKTADKTADKTSAASSPAAADVPNAVNAGGKAPPSEGMDNAETGDYEIDYEEEPEGDSEEAPAPVKKKHGKKTAESVPSNPGVSYSSSTGTHSKNKFGPMLKSDTQSVYKKNGHALDVDTD